MKKKKFSTFTPCDLQYQHSIILLNRLATLKKKIEKNNNKNFMHFIINFVPGLNTENMPFL